MNVTTIEDFCMISISHIRPSERNPRTAPTKEGIQELAASIKEKGILNPLIVRFLDPQYEVICGHRRLAAAKLAGLVDVPVIVQNLSDEEAEEIAIVDNLQRENLSPLEEAAAYKALQKSLRCDLQVLAAKVGKSRQYVAQRLSLLELHPNLTKALASGKLTLGSAFQFARIGREDQERIFEENASVSGDYDYFADQIKRTAFGTLANAPWKMTDATLAGMDSCKACHKRTGANADLFPDVKKGDFCTDSSCWMKKMDAHIQRTKAEAKKEGKKAVDITEHYYSNKKGVLNRDQYRKAEPGCEKPLVGIFVDGSRTGRTMVICTEKTCKACRIVSSGGAEESRHDSWSKREAAKRKKRKAENEYRAEVFAALWGKAENEPTWGPMAEYMISTVSHDTAKRICDALGWEPAKASWGGKDYGATLKKHMKDDLAPIRFLNCIPLAGLLDSGISSPVEATALIDAARAAGVPELLLRRPEPEKKVKKAAKPVKESTEPDPGSSDAMRPTVTKRRTKKRTETPEDAD